MGLPYKISFVQHPLTNVRNIMNKTELISAMALEAGMSKQEAGKALSAFISVITTALKKNEKVSLVGFGNFIVTERAARTGINPSTKETIRIPAKKLVKFKPGSELTIE